MRRPRAREPVCLADFAAWYNYVACEKSDSDSEQTDADKEYPLETEMGENVGDDVLCESDSEQSEKLCFLIPGGGKLVKRQKCKIIRSVRFHRHNDAENYFREQLMLYTPWRKEEEDLTGNYQSYYERFEQLKCNIFKQREQYEYNCELFDKAIEYANSNIELFEDAAPCTEHNELQDQKEAVEMSGCFNAEKERNSLDNYNMLDDDFGMFPTSNNGEELLDFRLDDNTYRKSVRLLNREQMDFFTMCYTVKRQGVNI